jgi:hypothetical protein
VTVIFLWSAPRSMSTAFTRMMLERRDTLVVHEPISNLLSVGRFEVEGMTLRTPADLLGHLLALGEHRSVFVKDTSELRYMSYLDERVVHEATHTFLVRDPAAAIASHHAVNPDLTLDEVGFEHLHEIFVRVRDALGSDPVVVDAADLSADPAGTVRAYCDAVGLPFLAEALTWSPGRRGEWARTEHWHHTVNDSSGFHRGTTEYARTVHNDARLARFRDHHQPFYDRITARRAAGAREIAG